MNYLNGCCDNITTYTRFLWKECISAQVMLNVGSNLFKEPLGLRGRSHVVLGVGLRLEPEAQPDWLGLPLPATGF